MVGFRTRFLGGVALCRGGPAGRGTFGVVASAAGLTKPATLAMSGLVFAGASQFLAVTMLASGAPIWSIVTSTLAINLNVKGGVETMLGAIIGDIVGSRFEFNNHRSKDFELFAQGRFPTDDSIMTLAVAKAIMETEKSISGLKYALPTGPKVARAIMGPEKSFRLSNSEIIHPPLPLGKADAVNGDYHQLLGKLTVKYMQKIGRKYPNCGYGGMFARWVFRDHPQPYNSFGNGAAMRISPAGFAARTEAEAASLSRTITSVTHNHEEGIKGAEATVVAIYMARRGFSKSEIRERIAKDYYPLDFTIDEIRPTYRFNETCQGTVPQAIEAFLESKSFEDAIRTAISLGGDSDTLGAITGAIAEAYYGVPDDMREKALSYLDDELRAIYDEWEGFMGIISRKVETFL